MRKNMKKRSRMALLVLCFAFAGILFCSENIAAAQISSISQAKEEALKKVPGAVVTDADSDYEKGVLVYDVELVKGKKEYNIKYRASDAKVLEYGWDKLYVKPSREKELISKSQCKKLAAKKVKNGTIVSCVKRTDDGVDIYKIKMTTKNKRYTLVYHARTGALVEYEWVLTSSSPKESNDSDSSETKKGYIGVSEAKQIALAAVPGATVIKAEFDMDDGVPVYEVELIKGNYEYDLEIHAETGKILKQEREWND